MQRMTLPLICITSRYVSNFPPRLALWWSKLSRCLASFISTAPRPSRKNKLWAQGTSASWLTRIRCTRVVTLLFSSCFFFFFFCSWRAEGGGARDISFPFSLRIPQKGQQHKVDFCWCGDKNFGIIGCCVFINANTTATRTPPPPPTPAMPQPLPWAALLHSLSCLPPSSFVSSLPLRCCNDACVYLSKYTSGMTFWTFNKDWQ